MRRILLFIVVITALSSCHHNHEAYSRLATIDSLLTNELSDSALQMIEQTNTSHFDEEATAYYYLLKTQTMYKAYQPIVSDSIIRQAVLYYKKSGNKRMLARALLYNGCILRDLGKQKEAMTELKEAEQVVEDVDDNILRHNIYFYLASLNSYFEEKQLALDYVWKAISCSQKTRKSDHLAHDFLNCSIYHFNMGHEDSCRYYINKCFALIDSLPQNPPSGRAKVWKSMGFAYYGIDKTRSKDYLEKAIALAPTGDAWGALARIHLENNDTNLAIKLLAQSIEDRKFPTVQIGNIQLLSQIEQERGNYRRATELSRRAFALKDSLARQQQIENVKALQLEMDHKREREQAKRARNWLLVGIGVIIVVGLGLVVMLIRRHRQQIAQEQELITELEDEKRQANRELSKAHKTMSQLKRNQQEQDKTMRSQQKEWQRYGVAIEHGHQLWMEITGGANTKLWTSDDFKDFRTYYDSIDSAFAKQTEQLYEPLSPNLYMLAALEHMGKSYDDIMAIMGLNLGAFRTTRTRLNQKRRSS